MAFFPCLYVLCQQLLPAYVSRNRPGIESEYAPLPYKAVAAGQGEHHGGPSGIHALDGFKGGYRKVGLLRLYLSRLHKRGYALEELLIGYLSAFLKAGRLVYEYYPVLVYVIEKRRFPGVKQGQQGN